MRRIIISLIICFASGFSFAQSEAANWYFGYNSAIRFNQANNSVSSLSGGQINTNEGCASISDDSGDLLFYTDGITVWNKNHLVMSNGRGLFGDPSSTQSGIIVPKPDDPNIYYIFTVDNHDFDGTHLGLNYSTVDMSLDGGLGAITTKNTNLLQECSEKVTAVLKDCISKSIWVVTFSSEDGISPGFTTFHAFEVSNSGVSNTAVKSPFTLNITENRGYLKLSPDGKKMACANVDEGLFVYDFNASTGKVSNQVRLNINSPNGNAYGLEFSPNSQLLYVHASNDYFDREDPSQNEIASNHRSLLIQYNLSASDIQGSAITIDDRQLYRGGLQLGPNGKIYRALSETYTQGLPFLGAINNPNVIGAGCNYQHNAVSLSPNTSSQGLPPFIQSFFNAQIDIIQNGESTTNLALCVGDSYTLKTENIPGASYIWTLDNNLLGETDYDLEVASGGHYEVYIDPNNGDCAIEGEAFVIYNENPVAYDHTILQCDEDGTLDRRTLFNLNEANDILTGGVANLSTKFYTDISRTSGFEIDGDIFRNTSDIQTIYVEVVNNNTGCFDYSELTIAVSSTDANDVSLPPVCDDDGDEDGYHIFNLKDAESDIIDGLPAGLDVSYFETYNDALLEVDNLGTSFKNTIRYNQTIYARVENANNCYGISEVHLVVNKLPNIDTDELTYYCLNRFPQNIRLNAGVIGDSPSNYTYLWSHGDTNYETPINEPGTYTVTVTSKANGCSKERRINVEASNIATINSIEVVDASQNNTITVLASGEGLYEYALLNSEGVQTPFQTNNAFENVAPGIYTVIVSDSKNDCGEVPNQVSVIGFPKFFTPNNDGVNDTWQVVGISGMFQPNSTVLIFNRFGKLVKQLNPLGEGWNGRFKGERLPADDYWFAVTLQDGRVFKNHFTLKY